MKNFALAALAAAALATPALADGHARSVAVMVFNQSEDNPLERTPLTSEPMFVDITQDMTLAEVLDQINMNAAMSEDQINNMFLTIVGNTNLAQDIFDDLEAESRDDDN
ncbi:MAG: hypothetical protein AAGA70_01500 [Pseudomonadota bacterium]